MAVSPVFPDQLACIQSMQLAPVIFTVPILSETASRKSAADQCWSARWRGQPALMAKDFHSFFGEAELLHQAAPYRERQCVIEKHLQNPSDNEINR
jgi:hypothetical protein